jgi:photosystem II stability/assembly factor-like uncharacterized protein
MILLLATLLAQWEPLKLPEAVAGKTLRGVAAVGQIAWIVGDQGLCLRSADGGKAWEVRPLGTPATLRAVRFLNDKAGLVVGDGDPDAPKPAGHVVMGRQMTSATVLWTQDGGQTWKKGHPPTNFEITCAETRGGPVQLGNSGGEGHLDGDILRSAGGVDAFKSRRCYRALFDIRALDEKRWVAVGSPVSVGFTPPPTEPLYTDKNCRALVSRDGGETWTPSKGSDGPGCLRAMAVGSRLFAVGDGGVVLSSEDKGETWVAVTTGCADNLNAVASTAQAVIAVGDHETALVSPDGRNWKRTSSGKSAFLAVDALGDGFLAVGEAGVARRASAKALLAAKAVEPPPAKPAAKGPSKAQRERFRSGSVSLYEVDVQAPAMNLKLNFQREEKITAVSATSYTIDVAVVKGTPPPGSPTKGSLDIPFESVVDVREWKPGESREESDRGGRLTRTRLPDETVKVGEHSLECVVVEEKAQSTDGGTSVRGKNWFAKSADVPGLGLVKTETLQEMAGPQGKITVNQTVKLLSWRRGKE